ncbi:hypothetical protein DWV00_24885 [Trinickia dinghuensis]|uniref:Uncharacterized protein n=1 Tax=Trinickia dinghuensis TaxID=2291023 RepID=A0A3D8JU58_9BURK|nr:hypothetical protein DWV00_24885 [Trinickia dinghuensis]
MPASVSANDFAAWVRIAVQYADHESAMPLLRLDRHGLTVAVPDDADAPALGLPRRALIIGDSAPLCELRLVARSAAREAGQPMTATLQPSRADDHALLWQSLVAYRAQLGAAPSCAQAVQSPSFAPSGAELRYRVACDAAFTLANHEDACFFSRWLDYYFAEVCARAKMSDATADLREMFMRVVDHEVEVRFAFHAGERVVRTSAEAACRWIAAQASQQLGMTVEHWLSGTTTACSSPAGWSMRAVMASRAGNYSS